jgi:hypothetical protein
MALAMVRLSLPAALSLRTVPEASALVAPDGAGQCRKLGVWRGATLLYLIGWSC